MCNAGNTRTKMAGPNLSLVLKTSNHIVHRRIPYSHNHARTKEASTQATGGRSCPQATRTTGALWLSLYCGISHVCVASQASTSSSRTVLQPVPNFEQRHASRPNQLAPASQSAALAQQKLALPGGAAMRQPSSAAKLNSMPGDVAAKILGHLSCKDLLRAALVSRQLRAYTYLIDSAKSMVPREEQPLQSLLLWLQKGPKVCISGIGSRSAQTVCRQLA
jgi:hypothetical protein